MPVAGRGVGVELDLRREVRTGVLLVPRRHRGHLRVAQVEPRVRVEDAVGDRLLVPAGRQHVLAPLAHDDRGAGVLAHGQHARGGDVGVLEQVEGDEPVVVGGLGVVDDPTQLGEVGWAQVVRDVVHGLVREGPQRLAVHLEERAPARTSSVLTPSVVSRRYSVWSGPMGSRSSYSNSAMGQGLLGGRFDSGSAYGRRSADVPGVHRGMPRAAARTRHPSELVQAGGVGAGPADREPGAARARSMAGRTSANDAVARRSRPSVPVSPAAARPRAGRP